jgi:hypothetical protein
VKHDTDRLIGIEFEVVDFHRTIKITESQHYFLPEVVDVLSVSIRAGPSNRDFVGDSVLRITPGYFGWDFDGGPPGALAPVIGELLNEDDGLVFVVSFSWPLFSELCRTITGGVFKAVLLTCEPIPPPGCSTVVRGMELR